MIKITFLKKDELAKRIYKTIWDNRNLWYLPKLRQLGGHHHGFHIYKTPTQLFVYKGILYIERDINQKVLINKPEHVPFFSDDEIYSTVVIENVDFHRKKGDGKFLTEENLERRFELIEAKNPFDENCKMNPLAKLMAMHKTIMAEFEATIEKSKNINNDGERK
ncbi:MAG: hypothetical protein K5873_12605 [Treponema sp.]|nr:hypothetical protein [Treponema sp.]